MKDEPAEDREDIRSRYAELFERFESLVKSINGFGLDLDGRWEGPDSKPYTGAEIAEWLDVFYEAIGAEPMWQEAFDRRSKEGSKRRFKLWSRG